MAGGQNRALDDECSRASPAGITCGFVVTLSATDSGTWRPFVNRAARPELHVERRFVSHDADEVSHLQVHAIKSARLGAQL